MGIHFALANLSLLHTLSMERNLADVTTFVKTAATRIKFHSHKMYQSGCTNESYAHELHDLFKKIHSRTFYNFKK